jgi:hypothetical protein
MAELKLRLLTFSEFWANKALTLVLMTDMEFLLKK